VKEYVQRSEQILGERRQDVAVAKGTASAASGNVRPGDDLT
jgi:hypothetical protein